jgi:hypothetical protein
MMIEQSGEPKADAHGTSKRVREAQCRRWVMRRHAVAREVGLGSIIYHCANDHCVSASHPKADIDAALPFVR